MARFAPLVWLIAATLVLTGCSPQPEPTPTATAAPEPTATAEAAVRPNPVVDLTCADLLRFEEVQSRISAPVSVLLDEDGVGSNGVMVAQQQRGGLVCSWGGVTATSFELDDLLEIVVLPEAAGDYAVAASEGGTPASVTGADAALASCWIEGDPLSRITPNRCTLTALSGSTMVAVRFADSQGSYADAQELTAVVVELAELAMARSQSAGIREQEWTPPANALVADDAFCGEIGGALAAELGIALPYVRFESEVGITGAGACYWYLGGTDVAGIGALVTTGAAWAAAQAQAPASSSAALEESRVTASGATWWLGKSDSWVSGRAAVDGSLVVLSLNADRVGASRDEVARVLAAVMEQYAEAAPGT